MADPQRNRYFDDVTLAILAAPQQWKLMVGAVPPDIRPCTRPQEARLKWSRVHSSSHPRHEILMVLRGSGWFGYRGLLYPARPGTVFSVEPFDPHDRGYPNGMPDAEHLWMFVTSEDRILVVLHRMQGGQWADEPVERWVFSSNSLGASLTAACVGDPNDSVPPKWRRQRCLNALHSVILRIVAEGYRDAQAASPQKDIRREVVECIQDHLRHTAGCGDSLDSLARMAGYSKFHLLRIFRRYTGHTVLEYINQCRHATVRRMKEEGATHRVIGESLGFSSATAFSRWYHTEGLADEGTIRQADGADTNAG